MSVKARIASAATSRALATRRAAALACALFVTLPISSIGNLGFISPAQGEQAALTKSRSEALNRYNKCSQRF